MNKRLEEYLISVVTGEHCSFTAKLILILLSVLEIIYILLVKTREILYNINIFSSCRLDCRVISIGNITAGGTGKTPAVEKLAAALVKQGKKVVIISRGYRSKTKGVLVVSDETEILVDAEKAGDEVYMLAKHLPGIPVVAGKNRCKAGRLAQEKFSPDIILLDDGFQHWQLQRDMDVVVIDAMNPFGYFHLLPRGFLREPLSALKRVDVFIISRADHVTKKRMNAIKRKLKMHNKQAEVLTSVHQPLYLQSLLSGDKMSSLEALENKKVLAVSGIGNPESFIRGLEDLQAEVVESINYPDHYRYDSQDLMDIAVRAQLTGADWVVTTEKDAVKFTGKMIEEFGRLEVGIFSLGIELEFTGNISYLNKLIG